MCVCVLVNDSVQFHEESVTNKAIEKENGKENHILWQLTNQIEIIGILKFQMSQKWRNVGNDKNNTKLNEHTLCKESLKLYRNYTISKHKISLWIIRGAKFDLAKEKIGMRSTISLDLFNAIKYANHGYLMKKNTHTRGMVYILSS